MAHQCKESGYGKGLITVAENFVIDGMLVVEVGEEGDKCVYGDHEKYSDYAVELVLGSAHPAFLDLLFAESFG
jgi:hypothetical protein